jgi:hypothetical protein
MPGWRSGGLNIAERLYRVTGGGIYRDTAMLGREAPTRKPLLNALVFGSDSVISDVYRGRIHWFWGDTNKTSYPLGNFDVPGATSSLPSEGGLDPARGVDLDYFVDEKTGFARPTAKMPARGPTWIGGMTVLRDSSGGERMFAGYVKVRPPMEVYEHGLVEWDDEAQRFAKVATFAEKAADLSHRPHLPGGRSRRDGVRLLHDALPPDPAKADPASLADVRRYEGLHPAEGGHSGRGPASRPRARRPDRVRLEGRHAPPLAAGAGEFIKAGVLKPEEA